MLDFRTDPTPTICGSSSVMCSYELDGLTGKHQVYAKLVWSVVEWGILWT